MPAPAHHAPRLFTASDAALSQTAAVRQADCPVDRAGSGGARASARLERGRQEVHEILRIIRDQPAANPSDGRRHGVRFCWHGSRGRCMDWAVRRATGSCANDSHAMACPPRVSLWLAGMQNVIVTGSDHCVGWSGPAQDIAEATMTSPGRPGGAHRACLVASRADGRSRTVCAG